MNYFFIGPLLCLGIAFIFVSSLYVWVLVLPSTIHLDRDNPRVVFLRSISVVLSTFAAIHLTRGYCKTSFPLASPSFRSLPCTFSQTCILMLGPIVHQIGAKRKSANLVLLFRNLVVAPVCEEAVFRWCFYHILKCSGLSTVEAGILAPVIFAMAHVHHHRTQTFSNIIGSVAHTCVFGWIAFYFLTTRSLWDAILSHVVCNFIGLPYQRCELLQGKYLAAVYITGGFLFLVSMLSIR